MWNSTLKCLLFFSICSINVSKAQSSFIPLNDDYYHLLDRYEIKDGKFSKTFHSGSKPFDRKAAIEFLNTVEQNDSITFTEIDQFNFRYLRRDSWEWTADTLPDTKPREDLFGRPIQGKKRIFWEHPSDLYSYRDGDFDIHVNLVTNNFIGEDKNLGRALLYSGRGVELRGIINKKLGFYTFITDNQGYFPKYIQEYSDSRNFPSEGLTKIGARKGVDFFSGRGYITFNPLKSINVQFGHDRNFFGNGFRSLALSDHSSPYLFLKINTQIGRFRYTNLWSSMINSQEAAHEGLLLRKKYTAMHHLSVNITDRFNLGVFEAEVFNRDSTSGGFDLNYMNPIIFYRFVESYLGSSDNALIGLDFKWFPVKNVSAYGQFMVDEFLSKDYFNGMKSWTKKYGLQLGSKYIDAFGVPHLDLQAEFNVVRPYTYSHRTGGKNYMHYHQPLAHPLESNFRELVTISRYQLNNRLTIYGAMILARKGVDPPEKNYGGDITKDYETRVGDRGIRIGQGTRERTRIFDLRVSYMLTQNLFLDYRLMRRRVRSPLATTPKTGLVSLGIRYNMPYRQQLF